ncbi:unnamed protein product, partial [Choristocarpus tenellus]
RIWAKGVLSAVFLVRKKNKTKEGGTWAFAVLNAILHLRLGIHAQSAPSRIWASVPTRRLETTRGTRIDYVSIAPWHRRAVKGLDRW